MKKTLDRIWIAGIVAASGSLANAQPHYKLIPIPALPGGTSAEAFGINNIGQAVGRCVVGSTYHGFVFDSTTGVITDIGDLGGAGNDVGAYAINDSGVVVGSFLSPTLFTFHAFRWEAGVFSDISINMTSNYPYVTAHARAINSVGQITGEDQFNCNPSAAPNVGCRWSAGGGSVIPVIFAIQPCASAWGYAINSAGKVAGDGQEIVGSFSWYRPFLWSGGSQIELPSFSGPANHAYAYGINDLDQVCGWCTDQTGSIGSSGTACWWPTTGTIMQLHDLSGFPDIQTMAWSINNSTDIVGTQYTPYGPALIWPGGASLPLDLATLTVPPQPAFPAGWQLVVARSIGDTGYIAGTGNPPGGGYSKGFVLAPCTPEVTSGPVSFAAYVHHTGVTWVTVVGAGPFTYQWRRNAVPLSNGPALGGGTISGADTAVLTLTDAGFADMGNYDVVVTGPCGTVTTSAIDLTVGHCPSDFNHDEFVDPLDYNGFINAFEAGDMSADYNQDGFLDPLDYNAYINAYEAGC